METLHSGYFHPVLRQYQEVNTDVHSSHLMYPLFLINT
ncbi:hypothetical protein X975_23383, partial [Stegodyphus mimosarum]